MAEVLQMLLDMGFQREHAEKALSVTAGRGIEAATEWLLAHPDGDDGGQRLGGGEGGGSRIGREPSVASPKATATGEASDEEEEVKQKESASLQALSLKCDDCGKQLRSELEAQTHAGRTGHQNFSESVEEIKPLTEEEKKEKLAQLQQRIKQRRAEREEEEKMRLKEQEKMRRKTGREITDVRQEMELREAKKIAEQKKREKIEEKLARQKVKDEIAKDRAERAAAAAKQKAGASTQQPPTQSSPAAPAAPKKDYDTCRLQIRLFGGKTLVQSFPATQTLIDVNRFILANRTDDNVPYDLMTTFPRHVFTADEMNKSLKELNLVPSAVLILSQPH